MDGACANPGRARSALIIIIAVLGASIVCDAQRASEVASASLLAEEQRPIGLVIMAQGRSGSTMLGETFRQNKDVLYWYEPCRAWGEAVIDGVNEYYTELHGEECSSLVRRLARCEFLLSDVARLGVDPPALASGSPDLLPLREAARKRTMDAFIWADQEVRDKCKRSKAIVVKTIRADTGVGGADGNASGVLVLHLVRDPRAVIYSQIKTFNVAHKYRRYFNKPAPTLAREPTITKAVRNATSAEAGSNATSTEASALTALPWAGRDRAHALGLIICGVYLEQMDTSCKLDESRYLRVRYEDIALMPTRTIEHIYDWSGLGSVPGNVSEWVHEHTRLDDCGAAAPTPVAQPPGRRLQGDEKFAASSFGPREGVWGRHEEAVDRVLDAPGYALRASASGAVRKGADCTERMAQHAEWDRYGTRRHAAAMAGLWRLQMLQDEADAVWEACAESRVMGRMGYSL